MSEPDNITPTITLVRHSYDPTVPQLDITGPQHVEVELQEQVDGLVLYVHVQGVTVLRVCKLAALLIDDNRRNTDRRTHCYIPTLAASFPASFGDKNPNEWTP